MFAKSVRQTFNFFSPFHCRCLFNCWSFINPDFIELVEMSLYTLSAVASLEYLCAQISSYHLVYCSSCIAQVLHIHPPKDHTLLALRRTPHT